MRSFLHHRIYAQGATQNLLFFGCRKRERDYHYREEWEQLESEGRLKVFAACSRDQVNLLSLCSLVDLAALEFHRRERSRQTTVKNPDVCRGLSFSHAQPTGRGIDGMTIMFSPKR